jgi:hypothetical protein
VDNTGFERPTDAIGEFFFLPFAIVAVICV